MTRRDPSRLLHLMGAPVDLGAGRRGVDMGPSAVRISRLADRLRHLGHKVVDRGDVSSPGQETSTSGPERKKYIGPIAEVCREVHEMVLSSLGQGAVPVVLGGDHSVSAGSVSAVSVHARRQGASLGLIWLDAHADMNTPQTSTSGNVHGMALAALLGPEPAELALMGGPAARIDPGRTVLLGLRNLDDLEKTRVTQSGVHVFTMRDIDRDGIAAVAEQAMDAVGRDVAGLHVSLDLDVCDPSIAPGVGTPVRGGLGYREAHLIMEVIADTGRLTSLDLVEINPILDTKNATAELGTELVLSAFGKRIL